MKMQKSGLSRVVCCTIAAMILGAVCLAQEGSSSSKDKDNTGGASSDGQTASAGLTNPSIDPTPGPSGSPHRLLGTPLGLSIQPDGTKVGPLTLSDVSTSGFYVHSTAPGAPSQTLFGNSTSMDVFYQHHTDRNTFTFQTTPQFSLTDGRVYVNDGAGFSFTRQLTPRWTLMANDQFSYLQNTLLQDPQNVLAYGNGGYYLQTVYAQQMGASTYNNSNVSMSYQLSGKDQLSLSPQLGVTFMNQSSAFSLITYMGGGGTWTHTVNLSRSVYASYNFLHSSSSTDSNETMGAWNTNTFGVGFTQQFGQSWWLTGNISASYQGGVDSYWLPVGNLGLMKKFRNASLLVAYSRSQAEQVLVSSGYFDQADLSYSQAFGRKFSASLGAAAFRTVNTGARGTGKRVFGSVSYRWIRNMSWVAAYSFSSQHGNQQNLNIGDSSYISIGLRWNLGRVPRL
jgi:hypothetical protein